ncbi:hypothetical protein ACWGS8_06335, partial [Mesorhizobium sp. 43Arga]
MDNFFAGLWNRGLHHDRMAWSLAETAHCFVMYGRPLLGKRQNDGDGVSLERSCIRPLVRSISMTADQQGLRGSVPIILARFGVAMTKAECADPGPDHFA